VDRLHSLRSRFVDAPDSVGAKYRQKRSDLMAAVFPGLPEMTVLDLGGTVEFWRHSPIRPRHLHVVNLEPLEPDIPEWAEVEVADACDLPSHIRRRTYDLVFSNSVIEHVGGHLQRQKFSDTVSSLSDRYWVQTPYRYFPVEPHWLCPGMQYLPAAARWRVARHWPLVHTPAIDDSDALNSVLSVDLLSRTEMMIYFPEARLLTDRLMGLTKSLVAVKG